MLRPLICPNCATENLAGAKFCMECGHTLNSGCPNCGFANLPGAKFCSECGTVLVAGIAPPNGGQPTIPRPGAGLTAGSATSHAAQRAEAERRLVSVLFVDLVGFTPFAEERDSEDVRETLTRYFDLARDVIERYGGTVEKFIGDAVMAVWGAPVAQEHDAELAVRAALELVDQAKALGSGIEARAGVLTGEAAVTIGATNQGMVAGDIVNTASRLQSAAPPGTVLVGEATHRAASAAISFEPAGEQLLKGKQSPVPAWRAIRVVAERGGRNKAEALEAPFVGRQEELRLLKDLFHATGREQRLRVVSVIGPAGIGKSRLAREFSLYIDGLKETVYWHSGRSPAYGEGITFWALGEMVRERAGLQERDDEATTRAKLHEMVELWVPDETEREWIEGALLTLLGVEGGMAADQLFGAWRTFFERIAQNGPVALVFEDMHFADAGLLDFIDHLLDFSRGLPIYVVTLARPDLIERRPDWGAGKRNFVSMYLEPLSAEDMRELLAGLVPGLPSAAVAAIVTRADGIPLYAVETIRSLVADGRLVEQAGVYVPQGDLTTLAVPETLTALIAARLDALNETDRRLVYDAAVLGQSFTVAALGAVSEVPEADLQPRLAALVRRELLRREMDARSPERGQYAFVQALIREVAYNTLSRKDRKKLHLAAARYFESLGNDEIAGALASHYLAAHANAAEGEEADALASQARIALKAAASRARSLGSYDQAVQFAEQALTVTVEPSERVELMLAAAEDARIAGRMPYAEKILRDALPIARDVGPNALILRVTTRLARVLAMSFRPDEALAFVEPALAKFGDEDEALLADLGVVKGNVQIANRDFAGALATLEGLLPVAERRGLVWILGHAFIAKANAFWSLGRRREALGIAHAARELAIEHGLTDIQLKVMGNLANAMTETDQQAAMEASIEAIALARKLGLRGQMILGIANFGYGAFLAGEWDAGLKELDGFLATDELGAKDRLVMLNNASIIRLSRGEPVDEALQEMASLGADMSGNWRMFLADPEANVALAKGELNEARAKFVAIAEDDPGVAPEYFPRAATASMWAGDLPSTRELLGRYNETGDFSALADARRATLNAGIAALEGRSAEALALFKEGLRVWRATHSVWDEALCGIAAAELLDPADPPVAEIVASTRSILERLGAKPYLERLNSAVARAAAAAPAPPRRPMVEPAEVAVTD
jgi:class 3 adenylate cyclase/tetratricopeptide (TPR) repeat protein